MFGPEEVISTSTFNRQITYTGNLDKDEIFTLMNKVKVNSGTPINSSTYNAFAEFNYTFNPPSSTVVNDQFNLFDTRLLLDMSGDLLVTDNEINNALNAAKQTSQANYNSNLKIDILVDGDVELTSAGSMKNVDFYLGPNSTIKMIGNNSFTDCNFLTCSSSWKEIIIDDNADISMSGL
jgi:hypothetical protein